MSREIAVWTLNRPSLEAAADSLTGDWATSETGLISQGAGWTVEIATPVEVDYHDLPAEVAVLLPGASWFTEVSLSPAEPAPLAVRTATGAARYLAKVSVGVVEDPESGLSKSAGVRRVYSRRADNVEFSTLDMSFYFCESPMLTPEGMSRFVDTLGGRLPEALPRRYGKHWPGEFKVSEVGLDAFKDYLYKKRFAIFEWATSAPVHGVEFDLSRQCGWQNQFGHDEHNLSCVRVVIDEAVLRERGWESQLKTLWTELLHLIQPKYADVRILAGKIRDGSAYAVIPASTQRHPVEPHSLVPVQLPQRLGLAVALEDALLSQWPEFSRHAVANGSVGTVSLECWSTGGDVSSLVGPTPALFLSD